MAMAPGAKRGIRLIFTAELELYGQGAFRGYVFDSSRSIMMHSDSTVSSEKS